MRVQVRAGRGTSSGRLTSMERNAVIAASRNFSRVFSGRPGFCDAPMEAMPTRKSTSAGTGLAVQQWSQEDQRRLELALLHQRPGRRRRSAVGDLRSAPHAGAARISSTATARERIITHESCREKEKSGDRSRRPCNGFGGEGPRSPCPVRDYATACSRQRHRPFCRPDRTRCRTCRSRPSEHCRRHCRRAFRSTRRKRRRHRRRWSRPYRCRQHG